MRVGIVADLHIGNHRRFGGEMVGSINRRCKLTLETFSRAVDTALARQCEMFVVCGDLFDTSKPEPSVIAEVLSIIAGAADRMQFYVMVGNHDQTSAAFGDNALAPLFPHARVVDAPLRQARGDAQLLFVPFRTGDVHDWLPATLRELTDAPACTRRALFLHMGIKDATTPPWLKDSKGAYQVDDLSSLCEEFGIDHAFAGDWHEHRHWRSGGQPGDLPQIMQVGTLCPTGFDNPGTEGYGKLVVFDVFKQKTEVIEIPGPRFLKFPAGRHAFPSREGCTYFVSQTVHPDQAKSSLDDLNKSIDAGTIEAGEIIVDKTAIEQAAGKAARAATHAGSLSEALSGYVDKMHLEEGVDRAEVLTRARRYLKVS